MKNIAVPFLIFVTQTGIVQAQQTGAKSAWKTVTVYTTADTKTGKLIYTNAYYYLGHFQSL